MKNLIANESVSLSIVDDNSPIRILISSLSLGGAEKIVADWASSEGSRGRNVEIAVIHSQDKEHKITSSNVKILRRGKKTSVSSFLKSIVSMWGTDIPVSTHLLSKNIHSFLWDEGVKTVPVVHNDKRGWKMDATDFNHPNVVGVVACAEYVKTQLIEEGYLGDVMVIRHLPLINNQVFDTESRNKLRKKFGIDSETIIVGMIGAIKVQKNYERVIEIAKQSKRKVEFLIFGDSVNQEGVELKNKLFDQVEEHNLFEKIKFMGFREDIFKYFPIFDCVMNCSHYEGYSIATQEALLADLPVIAVNVSGQSEIKLDGLTLIDENAPDSAFVEALDLIKVREVINQEKMMNASRIWSLSVSQREQTKKTETLFLTANLNAGGAQRSLVNLTSHLNKTENLAIAVCNETTNNYFPEKLQNANVEHFQLSQSRDVFDLTQSLLNQIHERGVEKLVLWNVDPKMKLLLSAFLPSVVDYYDISPGGYAFEELDATVDFQKATTIKTDDFYSRLNKLVLKYDADTEAISQYDVETEVIRNGVEDWAENKSFDPANKEILVSGRIVESKHILSIIRAFKEFNKGQNQEYRLNFFGQAEERNRDYLEQVNMESSGENIVFHGADPYLSFMKENFAMTIILGTHQGCPNAALESASGLIPIIANDSGGTREIMKDNISGLLIPDQFSHDELLSAMNKMISLDREKLAENAKAIVNKNFSMSLMEKNYSNLLNKTKVQSEAA